MIRSFLHLSTLSLKLTPENNISTSSKTSSEQGNSYMNIVSPQNKIQKKHFNQHRKGDNSFSHFIDETSSQNTFSRQKKKNLFLLSAHKIIFHSVPVPISLHESIKQTDTKTYKTVINSWHKSTRYCCCFWHRTLHTNHWPLHYTSVTSSVNWNNGNMNSMCLQVSSRSTIKQ